MKKTTSPKPQQDIIQLAANDCKCERSEFIRIALGGNMQPKSHISENEDVRFNSKTGYVLIKNPVLNRKIKQFSKRWGVSPRDALNRILREALESYIIEAFNHRKAKAKELRAQWIDVKWTDHRCSPSRA